MLREKQLRQELDRGLSTLPLEQRAVFVLYELEGFTLPEIAKAGAGTALWLLAAKWVALGMLGGGELDELQLPSQPVERLAASPRPGASTGQLGREVQQIDRARAAFAAGNAAQALAELDAFDHLAQTGVLEREARVLRIDALQKLGRTRESRMAAERYVQSYPNDAHAVRLRALLNDTH